MSETIRGSNFEVRYTKSDRGRPVAEVTLVVDFADADFYVGNLPFDDVETIRWRDVAMQLEKMKKEE
jgi:hypothetical protein